ncbi:MULTISPECIES: DUF397 domain-containing protein [Thermomonosporaceae]|uniref:DUF397 domain-containing protein n=1 Tax=Thermomonosporaceae TaxID=2012 RepID=UPI00255AD61E|nr:MULTISPECIES: DUF397 domain-containing protein [Thermomonosporaceae]MDL4774653.1 DUF397 domain-containing protein [Actinomadura xylanilytica]
MTISWRKSSYSGSATDEMCVELADLAQGIGIRDSKSPAGGRLVVGRGGFGGLVGRIKGGALDLPPR